MRFIHTADWHLGRLFHGIHLTDDQHHTLQDFCRLAKEAKVDAVLIAGDIYDRAIPPPEAVEVLDDVLSRLVLDLNVPVILISGNHDSPDRLGFASRLLAGRQLHIFGPLAAADSPVVVEDAAGPVTIYALPYAEPAAVRQHLDSPLIRDHQTALQALVERLRQRGQASQRTILMAHAFVVGGVESESERPLSVGGADAVDAACFAGFSYVALGHLHRPQTVGDGAIHYAGSLLKYSFSEASHRKSVNLVEMDAQGRCSVERIALRARRDVRCIEGYLADLLRGPPSGESREDYLMVTLLDRGALLDAMGKLRQVYPNLLHLERPALTGSTPLPAARADHRRMNDADLFAAFFSQVTGSELTAEERAAYVGVVEGLYRRQREAEP
jgi:exonuclease SbcD